MRVALYARFSSELQDRRSITDQIALAREHAARQGWLVVAEYSDAAISGASTANRPGLQDLMRAAEAGALEGILCESLDRLSRDLEDLAGIHKRLEFRGVKLVTLADGVVSTLLVGIRATVAKLYLEDLAAKTRRGQIGRVRAGRIPGGRCYGYDVVAGDERGQRVINEREAEVVRRIYREYAAGVSPMTTVRALNAEGVPGPRGGPWNVSTLLGSPRRRNGILNNELYVGQLIYNRQRFIKDPATGKRQSRANPPDQWITHELPELAIVDVDKWAAVRSRRSALGGRRLVSRRRPKHLLSGLLCCGRCGANMIVKTVMRSVTYFGCSTRINRGACDNSRLAPAPEIEARVLSGLKRLLLAPEAIEMAVEAYRAEHLRLAREQARSRGLTERSLAETNREIARIVKAIRRGGEMEALVSTLQELEARKKTLQSRLPTEGFNVVVQHPQAAQRYRQMVEEIETAFRQDDPTAARTIELVRSLIRRVTVTPTPGRQPLKLELSGNLAALIDLAEGRVRSTGDAPATLALVELRV